MALPGFENDPPIEYSPLGREVTRSGVTVRVLVYRVPSEDLRWTLEVEDHLGGSTCWENTFATAQEAYDVFEHHVKLAGIQSFTEPVTRH
jgi:hypothetical protein